MLLRRFGVLNKKRSQNKENVKMLKS